MKNTVKILLGVFIIIVLWWFSWYWITNNIELENRGSFGDMFGAINALFSGLALFGIIVSIFIQQKELSLQKDELKDTREEFKINRITSILFKQLDYLNSSVEKIYFYSSKNYSFNNNRVKIDDFVPSLNEIEENRIGLKELIDENSKSINFITEKIISILSLIEEIININKLETIEKVQIKTIFIKNLNPNILPLIAHKVRLLKTRLENEKIDKDERNLIKLEVDRYLRILEFGMNK